MLAVIPILVGPLQALIAALPAILMALGWLIVSLFKPSTMKKLVKLLWAQKIPLALIVFALWGLSRLFGMVFPKGKVSDRNGASAKTDWPLFRGDVGRTGFVPGAEDPVSGNILWSFSHDGVKTFYASPAVIGNRLYITSARWEFFKKDGAICCVDAATGKLVWAFSDKYRATFSSPAISGKYLVVGEGLHLTEDARVFCLDLEQSEKKRAGVPLWSYRTKSHVESSPAIADGKAFIGAGNDGLYCFALEPGKNGSAKVVWHLDGKKYPDCEASPIAHEGKVYFGLGIGGQAIVCADANTGAELWRIKTPYPVFSGPSISGKKLFAAMGVGDFVNDAGMLAGLLRMKMEKEGRSSAEITAAVAKIKPAGEIWCVNLETHAVEWTFPVADTVLGSIAVENGRLYFGSRDRNIYCVSTDGKLLKKRNVHASIVTSPALGKAHVYAVTEAGRVLALSKEDLSPAWELPLNSPAMSSPAIANGHVYVGTTKNGLVCAGQPGGSKEKPLWAGALGGPGKSGWMDGSLLAAHGEYAWSYPPLPEGAAERTVFPEISAPAAYLEGALYVGYNAGQERGLLRLDFTVKAETDLADIAPPKVWLAKSANKVSLSPAVSGATAFFVDGKPGDKGRALHAVETATGKELWAYPVEDAAPGEFVIDRDRLLIASTGIGLACLDISKPAAKKELWAQKTPTTLDLLAPAGSHTNLGYAYLPGTLGAPAPAGDIIIGVARDGVLFALDSETGAILWKVAPAQRPTTGPLFANGTVWVGDEQGVTGYRLVDGKPAFSIACGAVSAPLVYNSDRIACVTRGREISVIDAIAGKELDRVKGPATAGFAPVFMDGELLFAGEESIDRYDLATRETAQWTKLRDSWPGRMTSPMIMVNSNVLFATDKEGFLCMKPRVE